MHIEFKCYPNVVNSILDIIKNYVYNLRIVMSQESEDFFL